MAQQHFVGGVLNTSTSPYTWGPVPAGQQSGVAVITPGIAERVTGAVFSDQPGTVHIQQSGNGTDWDIDTTYAVTANTPQGFDENILLAYLQVYFVNTGAAATGTFRLYARASGGGPWVG